MAPRMPASGFLTSWAITAAIFPQSCERFALSQLSFHSYAVAEIVQDTGELTLPCVSELSDRQVQRERCAVFAKA